MLAELLLVLAGHPSSLFPVVYAKACSTDGEDDNNKAVDPWLWTMRLSSQAEGLHPGERASLDSLASLAARHRRVKLFAATMQERIRRATLQNASSSANTSARDGKERQSSLLSPLVACLLRILRDFQQQVLDTEADILRQSWDMVSFQDGAEAGPSRSTKSPFVSLANIRSRFHEWETPLASLDALVTTLLKGPAGKSAHEDGRQPQGDGDVIATHPPDVPTCPHWPAGQLLDLLTDLARTAVGSLDTYYSMLLDSTEDAVVPGIVSWLCFGEPRAAKQIRSAVHATEIVKWRPATDDDKPETSAADASGEWVLDESTLPSWISHDEELKGAMLYVGRALSRINANAMAANHVGTSSASDDTTPSGLSLKHRALLESASNRPCSSPHKFKMVVLGMRRDLAEWIWSNLLTPSIVKDVFDQLGGILLCRDGLFLVALLERFKQTRSEKLLVTHATSSSTLRASDIELAFRNANGDIGLDETDRLSHLSIRLPERPRSSDHSDARIASQDRFSDLTLGTPFEAQFRPPFPIDFILSSAELQKYTAIHSFLLALNATRQRMRDSWLGLGKTQRARRRFTGTGEGGSSKQEEKTRAALLRLACGFVQSSAWLLDVLIGHFQIDVIDAQYTNLLAQLNHQDAQPVSSDAQGDSSYEDCVSTSTPLPSAQPATAPSGRSSRMSRVLQTREVASGADVPRASLDYTTIQATHSTFLTFVLDGLLLNDATACQSMREMLQTSHRFAGLVDRWGGDVLPELLGGVVADTGDDSNAFDPAQEARDRIKIIRDLQAAHDSQARAFFDHLSTASTKPPSMIATQARAALTLSHAYNASYTSMNLAASRHYEQLLLRLDFNGVLSSRVLASQG